MGSPRPPPGTTQGGPGAPTLRAARLPPGEQAEQPALQNEELSQPGSLLQGWEQEFFRRSVSLPFCACSSSHAGQGVPRKHRARQCSQALCLQSSLGALCDHPQLEEGRDQRASCDPLGAGGSQLLKSLPGAWGSPWGARGGRVGEHTQVLVG